MSKPEPPVLEIEDLTVEFRIAGRWWPAVRDLGFALARNETLALVGESGCGKSITALSIMGLVPRPQGRLARGRIRLEGQDLVGLDEPALEKIRGNRLAMIFQEPMTSLNPVLTVGFQVAEALSIHRGLDARAAAAEALRLLEEVKIPSAARRFDDYPHHFSGGMRQRVMIAMALACNPSVLLADEPTTALDVTIQAQVLGLLADLKTAHGMSMLFITHNLGIVAAIADRVAVMYAGEIVELASVERIFAAPTHPYTEALFRAIPRVDRATQNLQSIAGQVPAIDRMPAGCRFAPRCPLRVARCDAEAPMLAPLAADPQHQARCHVRAPADRAAAA
ncbi:MAG: ABC transporter ATP-binding protein [Alphaproteobacteria bacterium]|nr:ABC transporter ATP-binding protein [Alphaproteobacteria bacterium]